MLVGTRWTGTRRGRTIREAERSRQRGVPARTRTPRAVLQGNWDDDAGSAKHATQQERTDERDTIHETGPTDITLVVDRSGSMEAIRSDAEGGVNAFVAEQAKQPGEAL